MTMIVEQEPFKWDVVMVEAPREVVRPEEPAPTPQVQPAPPVKPQPLRAVQPPPQPSQRQVETRVAPQPVQREVEPVVETVVRQQQIQPPQEIVQVQPKQIEPQEIQKPEPVMQAATLRVMPLMDAPSFLAQMASRHCRSAQYPSASRAPIRAV